MENKHREPIFYIIGNPERANEIHDIFKNKWRGVNTNGYAYINEETAYYINALGIVVQTWLSDDCFKKAVTNGWMKEYKLSEKPRKSQFKSFDKVVVKVSNAKWYADIYSHEDEKAIHFIGNSTYNKEYTIILPYNEETAKLIGTNDEWKGDKK